MKNYQIIKGNSFSTGALDCPLQILKKENGNVIKIFDSDPYFFAVFYKDNEIVESIHGILNLDEFIDKYLYGKEN